jgi:beta-galactosidase
MLRREAEKKSRFAEAEAHLFKRWFSILLLGIVLLFHAARVPAADSPRQRFSLDFSWKFTLGDPALAEETKFNDATWRALDVPHDWSIEGTWAETNPSGSAGGYASNGIGWYRKTFRLPENWNGKQILVEFDGVFDHSDVWINGEKVGHNEYGYIGFECDLTPWLKFGKDNVIAVRVDNLKQASRWYTGSGIYRHVWLTVTDPLHVGHWGTYVTTPEITNSSAKVKVVTTLRNDSDTVRDCTLVTRLMDPHGSAAGTEQTMVRVPARGEAAVAQFITTPKPQLWAPGSPQLYHATSEVHQGARVIDSYETSFGIRTIKFDVKNGFTLNGKRIIIKGVCLHHDLGPIGAAALEPAIERRLKILMDMGVNAVRLSHNPYSPEMLELCDRLGLIVWDESFDKWYGFLPDGTGWKDDLKSFVQRDRNHPSVVIWSVGNEMTPHMYMREGTLLYQSMSRLVHRVDPTRPVTAALHPVRNAKGERDAPLAELAQYMDVIGMNYQTRFYARDHLQHPNQVLIGSETHLHQLNDLNAPVNANDGSGNQWFGTRDYFTNEYVPYVAGQFTWAAFDYLGEAGAWPSKGSRHNLIYSTGFRKPFSYYEESLYTDAPMVHIAVDNPDYTNNPAIYGGANWNALVSHWTWPKDLKTLRVYTFTNCPSVELVLNGKSLGVKQTADFADRIIMWDVPNEPGMLQAIAKKDGASVATHELKTSGNPARIILIPDKNALAASGQDLVHVEAQVVDSDGTIVPNVPAVIHFETEGPGVIAGVDNGDLDSPEIFKSHQRETRDGHCLVIVQSASEPGKIRLKAHAEGLPDATIELDVRQASGPPRLP